MSSEAAFSSAALRYLLRHAVEPAVAAELGVGELDGALTFAYQDADGEYRRRRPLDGSRTFQPPGRSLALWWPAGRPAAGADVLLCEGEPDALSALSALRSMNGHTPVEPPVVGAIPGTGTPVATIVDELRSAGTVTLALDGDKAGREFALRADRCAARGRAHRGAHRAPTGQGPGRHARGIRGARAGARRAARGRPGGRCAGQRGG